MSQHHCTSRAEWRLQTGKPAAALSAHYQLDCDYGTAVIICWKQGGSEPVYVCDSHAKQLGCSREHGSEVRFITAQSDQTNMAKISASSNPIKNRADSKDGPKVTDSCVPLLIVPSLPGPAIKPFPRDLEYGDSARAMVDEVIWNMEPGNYEVYRSELRQGKSPGEAARAAGGQLGMIHRKITDYTLKLQAVLSQSTATINVGETIDRPLEGMMSEIINNSTMSESAKDAFVQQLGTLQAWAKHGLRGEITPVQANRVLLALGDRLNWGATTSVSEEARPVYRVLYSGLKTAIVTAVPEAKNLHDRLTNLYAAKSDLDQTIFALRSIALTA